MEGRVLAALVVATLAVWALWATGEMRAAQRKCRAMQRVARLGDRLAADHSPYAHLLGRTVEARVYEGSPWEPMVVVAVSWHGAVCVRPASDPTTKGRWIKASVAPDRVREACHGLS